MSIGPSHVDGVSIDVDSTGIVTITHQCRLDTLQRGYIDSIRDTGECIGIQGWALNSDLEPAQSILVLADEKSVRTSDFRQFERRDVSTHIGLPPGVCSGFELYAHPRHNFESLRVLAMFSSGDIAEIPGAEQHGENRLPVFPTTPVETSDFTHKFAVPIVAFPPDSPYAGIYCTAALYNRRPRGVTAQFLENADTYHHKYTAHGRWRALLQPAFGRAGITASSIGSVIDLGSGSGNSVLPALDLLPSADVVATDISPQLLAILRRQLTPAQLERCHLVVADASEPCLADESFDLAIGAAILHHLFDPAEAIGSCARALRKGGRAVFFEPFEPGNAVLRCLYEELLDPRLELHLDPEVARMLENIVVDLRVRMGSNKSTPIFDSLDDKWLFTRRYFEVQHERFGFSKLDIFPLDTMDTVFRSQIKTHLRLVLDKGPEALPRAAWDLVDRWENAFSDDAKRELLLEGCVIMTK